MSLQQDRPLSEGGFSFVVQVHDAEELPLHIDQLQSDTIYKNSFYKNASLFFHLLLEECAEDVSLSYSFEISLYLCLIRAVDDTAGV